MRIFCQVGPHRRLRPESGDQITELNLLRALARFAEVDYSGERFDPDPQASRSRVPPFNFPRRHYDIYYVRNHPRLFRALPAPKIYFASPYDRGAFRSATALATLTKSWAAKLDARDPSLRLYPAGASLPPAFPFHQVIDPRFRPLRHDRRTQEIRARIGGDFVIGHFGRIAESCYPHSFLAILPELLRRFPGVRVLFAGGRVDHPAVLHTRFDYEDMPYAVSACDLILYAYRDHQGHFAGSMKVLEAMACGVPVLSPRYDARVEELGEDYELFHSYEANDGRFPPRIEAEMLEKLSLAIASPVSREKIASRLLDRSRFYGIGEAAPRLQSDLERVIRLHRESGRPSRAPRSAQIVYFATSPVVDGTRWLRRHFVRSWKQ